MADLELDVGNSRIEDRMVIRPAMVQDQGAIFELLDEVGLPSAGVDECLHHFLLAEVNGTIVGSAGLEIRDRQGILRSVAVRPPFRGRGIASRLVAALLQVASDKYLSDLYLLTTTAAGYFAQQGFRLIPRHDVPLEVQESVQFREVCPSSATAMVLELNQPI